MYKTNKTPMETELLKSLQDKSDITVKVFIIPKCQLSTWTSFTDLYLGFLLSLSYCFTTNKLIPLFTYYY